MQFKKMNKQNYKFYIVAIIVVNSLAISLACDLLGIPGALEKVAFTGFVISLSIQLYAEKYF